MSGQLATMVRVHLRTGWLAVVVWVVAVGGTVALTVSAIQGLYDSPEKIRSYAAAVHDDALMMINGRIAGIDSLGGIIANEFGFMASFAIPFMAVSLIARTTRKNEELGRLEAVLAGRIGRTTPLLAAILVAVVAEVLITVALFASFAGVGVPGRDAALYSLSMGALGLAFIGVASVAAQFVEHTRGVYAIGLGAIIAAYVLRGIGDVQWSPLTWLSPLGWQEQTRAFGHQRWWPLFIPLVVFALLVRGRARHRIPARRRQCAASRRCRRSAGVALSAYATRGRAALSPGIAAGMVGRDCSGRGDIRVGRETTGERDQRQPVARLGNGRRSRCHRAGFGSRDDRASARAPRRRVRRPGRGPAPRRGVVRAA